MAWIYLAGMAGLLSHCKNGLNRSYIVRSNDMHKEYYCLECCQVNCLKHPSGKILPPWKEKTLKEGLILSTEDSPARISALREREKAWKESEAVFFSRSSGLLARYDLHSSSWKTLQLSFLEGMSEFAGRWSNSGMIVGGKYYPLKKLEHHITERGGGYWATPNTMDHLPLRSKESLDRQFATTRKGRTKPANLREQVHPECWPTPTVCGNYNRKGASKTSGDGLATAVGMFPTPCARDWKDNGKSPSEFRRESPSVATVVGGKLNPPWVEWLMGVPLGHTELKLSVMGWFHSKQKKLSKT
jgi:hypothetical protein